MEIKDVAQLIPGDAIFQMMDTKGMPLSVLIETMRERNVGYDVVGFCRAAKQSGNFTPERTLRILETSQLDSGGEWTPELAQLCKLAVERAWNA